MKSFKNKRSVYNYYSFHALAWNVFFFNIYDSYSKLTNSLIYVDNLKNKIFKISKYLKAFSLNFLYKVYFASVKPFNVFVIYFF